MYKGGRFIYLAIIPAFNESESIANVVHETRKYVDRIVVIDDSSRDNTQRLALRSGAIVLQHLDNRGVGAAMITGIKYAQKVKPDLIVTLDADGQHNPHNIPYLIQPILDDKADWVLGSRFLQGSPANMPWIKKLGNRLFTFIVNILAGVNLTDTQTGFRALNQKALLALDLKSEFTYTQEMILVLAHNEYRGLEVPIHIKPRKYGDSKVVSNLIGYGLRSLVIILSTYLRQKTSK